MSWLQVAATAAAAIAAMRAAYERGDRGEVNARMFKKLGIRTAGITIDPPLDDPEKGFVPILQLMQYSPAAILQRERLSQEPPKTGEVPEKHS